MEYSIQPNAQYAGVIAATLLAATPSANARTNKEFSNLIKVVDVSNFLGAQTNVWTVTFKQLPSTSDITLVPDALKFRTLAVAWDQEAGVISSTTEMVMCPSYQKIIGMGESALPFIFRQLEKERKQPNNWFWALRAITGEDPVPVADRGNRPKMAMAWLRWGRKRYAW